jgi:hypothetical protein
VVSPRGDNSGDAVRPPSDLLSLELGADRTHMDYLRLRPDAFSGGAVVLSFDMCSSSDILEELILKNKVDRFHSLVGAIKHWLSDAQKIVTFDPYKFTGDGWILLLPERSTGGDYLLALLQGLAAFFRREFESRVMPCLDTPPKMMGLTFGLDNGPISAAMKIFASDEYVGRPINIACRLQTAVKDLTRNPQYQGLISASAFDAYLASAANLQSTLQQMPLRNIRGGSPFRCMLFSVAPS